MSTRIGVGAELQHLIKRNWLADRLRKRAVPNKTNPGRSFEHSEALNLARTASASGASVEPQ